MISKIFLLIALVAVIFCEEHHYTLQSIVKHEVPKKIEIQHHHLPVHTDYKTVETIHSAPILEIHTAPEIHGHAIEGHVSQGHVSHGHVGNGHVAESHGHGEVPHFFVPAKAPAPVHEPVHVIAPVIVAKHVPVKEAKEESHHEELHQIDYYAHPKYEYEYKVEDPHTGDNKFHHETRDGDVVKGVYSLHESDGSVRTVEYSSDKKNGFNAHIKHSGESHHVEQYLHHH